MDSTFSDTDEAPGILSVSLVSYGSDVESLNDSDSVIGSGAFSSIDGTVADDDCTISNEGPCLEELLSSLAQKLSVSGASQEKLAKLAAAKAKLKAVELRYLKIKLIVQAISEVTSDDTKLPPATAERVRRIMQRIDLVKYFQPIPTNGELDGASAQPKECPTLFGLTMNNLDENFPKELSPSDAQLLKVAVEKQILLNHEKLMQMKKKNTDVLSSILGRAPDNMNCAESDHTKHMISLGRELEQQKVEYERNLERLNVVLNNLLELRAKTCELNREITLQQRLRMDDLLNEIEAFKVKIEYNLYTEDKQVADAFSELKKQLDLIQNEEQSKNVQLKLKLSQYKKLSGTEFDEILSSYTQVLNDIKAKSYALCAFDGKCDQK